MWRGCCRRDWGGAKGAGEVAEERRSLGDGEGGRRWKRKKDKKIVGNFFPSFRALSWIASAPSLPTRAPSSNPLLFFLFIREIHSPGSHVEELSHLGHFFFLFLFTFLFFKKIDGQNLLKNILKLSNTLARNTY